MKNEEKILKEQKNKNMEKNSCQALNLQSRLSFTRNNMSHNLNNNQ